MEEKKNNNNLVIIFILISIIIVLVFGFAYYVTDQKIKSVDKDLHTLEKKVDNLNLSDENTSISSTNNNAVENTDNKCTGSLNSSYYGEYKDSIATIQKTYKFKNDGTYTSEVVDGEGNQGKYTLKDGIITLVGSGSFPGSDFTVELEISDDCNTITEKNDTYTMVFNKQ